ncbi:MAG: YIP1 family protein [archaeon]|nr:YIP1 family protein [archaeon]
MYNNNNPNTNNSNSYNPETNNYYPNYNPYQNPSDYNYNVNYQPVNNTQGYTQNNLQNNQNLSPSGIVGTILNNQTHNFTSAIVDQAQKDVNKGCLERFFCNPTFLKEYFDIETDDIKQRLCLSLNPFNKTFIDLINKKPDLYGPFWIYTTLVFVIAASGSLTKYLQGHREKEYFQQFVPVSASVVYGIGFALPFVIFILMKIFDSEAKFINILCIYAYSFFVFIPISILCIPIEKIQWPLLIYGVLSSTGFLLSNFMRELSQFPDSRKYFVLGVVFIFQICLLFILKFNFFKHISEQVITVE